MLKNLKCTYFTDEPVYRESLEKSKKHNFKINGISITIYGHSPLLLNVTGIKSWSDMKATQMMIEKEYQVKVLQTRVDCVFFSHKGRTNIDMSKIYYHVRDNLKEKYFVDYNIELHPRMCLQPRLFGYPTINLFRTGSYQILGGKSIDKIIESKVFVKNLILKYKK